MNSSAHVYVRMPNTLSSVYRVLHATNPAGRELLQKCWCFCPSTHRLTFNCPRKQIREETHTETPLMLLPQRVFLTGFYSSLLLFHVAKAIIFKEQHLGVCSAMLRAVFSKDCWVLRFTALLHRVIPACQGSKPWLNSHITCIQPTKTAWLLPVRPHWTQNMQHFLSSVTHKFQWNFSFLLPFSQCEVSLIFSFTFCLQWFCPAFQPIQLTVSLLAPFVFPVLLRESPLQNLLQQGLGQTLHC